MLSILKITHSVSNDNSFKGLSFVVTGSFFQLKRSEIEARIKRKGGKVGNPSKSTNFLVLGEGGGSKADKVQALVDNGVNIITLSENEIIEKLES